VAGGVLAGLQPWKGTLSPDETASLLSRKLRTKDTFDCHEPNGVQNPDEPSWTYVCIDLNRQDRQGYLVETKGDRITAIQPTS
jgi:hypothetical protein